MTERGLSLCAEGEKSKMTRCITLMVAVLALLALTSAHAELQSVKVGGDIRVRGVAMENVFDFDDDNDADAWEYYRWRTNVYVDARLTDDVRGFVQFNNEVKGQRFSDGTDNGRVSIEMAYIELANMWGLPLDLRIGRQPLIYGEGFLILDGTPFDGSTSIAFDALKATYRFGDNTLDLFTVKVAEEENAYADDDDLYGIYLTNRSLEKHQAEAYLFFDNQNSEKVQGPAGTGMEHPPQELWVLGTRWTGGITDALSYRLEVAKEWGDRNPDEPYEQDIDAWGGYASLCYAFEADWKPRLSATYAYYSGEEDPSSTDGDYEGFDPLFGDWPKWSELLIYTFYDGFNALKTAGLDPDYGSWTNMKIAELRLAFCPSATVSTDLYYQHYWADEETGLGGGDDRGDLFGILANYAYTEDVSTHVLLEWFDPDDYYQDDADDAFFARWHIMLKF